MTTQPMTDSPLPPPTVHEPSYPPPRPRPTHERAPFVAALLSGMVPGLGNVYNGLYLRGLTFFLVFTGLIRLIASTRPGPDFALFIPALIFTWFFNIFDAYRQATLINYYGYAGGAAEIPRPRSQPSGGIVLGAAVFLLGLLGLLHQVIPDFDLSVVFDYWYVAFLAFGAWMIYLGWRESRRNAVSFEPSSAASTTLDDDDVSAAA